MSRKLQNGDIRQYSIKPKKTIEIIDLDENENDENNQEEHEHDNENKEFENEINGEIENTNDNKVVDVSSDEFDSEKNKQQTKKIQKKSNKHSIEKFVYRLEIINNASENLNPTTDGYVKFSWKKKKIPLFSNYFLHYFVFETKQKCNKSSKKNTTNRTTTIICFLINEATTWN